MRTTIEGTVTGIDGEFILIQLTNGEVHRLHEEAFVLFTFDVEGDMSAIDYVGHRVRLELEAKMLLDGDIDKANEAKKATLRRVDEMMKALRSKMQPPQKDGTLFLGDPKDADA